MKAHNSVPLIHVIWFSNFSIRIVDYFLSYFCLQFLFLFQNKKKMFRISWAWIPNEFFSLTFPWKWPMPNSICESFQSLYRTADFHHLMTNNLMDAKRQCNNVGDTKVNDSILFGFFFSFLLCKLLLFWYTSIEIETVQLLINKTGDR